MKTFSTRLAALFLALLSLTLNSYAQEDITGTWQGNLQVTPDVTLGIQFTFARGEDGSYSALVNSPDNPGIKNIPAEKLGYSGDQLSFEVGALSGSYKGTVKGGEINGTWSQPGSDIPLVLKPFVKAELSEADKQRLTGTWFGKLKGPAGQEIGTFEVKFETDAKGVFVGSLRNADAGPNWAPLNSIALAGGRLEFSLPGNQAKYSGTFTDTALTGNLNAGGNALELNMSKGEYTPPKGKINLTDAVKSQLDGEWFGEMESNNGPVALILNFSSDAQGDFSAQVKFPDMGNTTLPFRDIEFNQDKLYLTLPAASVEYVATIENDVISGTWKAPDGSKPLRLQKGKYQAKPTPLDLSAQAMQVLSGTWKGEVTNIPLVVRFSTDDQGNSVGFVDSPRQNSNNIKITSATFVDNKISLKIAIGAEYNAEISGNTMTGEWVQAGTRQPLSLTKE